MPAFFNGIFGHKPSRYVVSNAGQYPIPETELLNSFLGITYLLDGIFYLLQSKQSVWSFFKK